MSDHHSDHLHPELTPLSMFVLKSTEQVKLLPGETKSLADLSAHMVVIVTEGTGFFHTKSAPSTITTGSALFVHEESSMQISSAEKEQLGFLLFDFDVLQQGSDSDHVYSPNRSWKPEYEEYFLHSNNRCTELAQTLYLNRRTRDPLEILQNQIRFQQLLHLIWSNPPSSIDEKSSTVVDRTVTYIHTNFADSIGLVDLAKQAGLTPRYYTEIFKKKVGKSPIEYLTSYRMEQAKKLLRESDKRLREVARLIGYEDEFYFSRRFKQQVGVSPSVYIRMSQKHVSPVTLQYAEYLMALGIRPIAAPEDQVLYLREQLQLKEADYIVSLSNDDPEMIKPLEPTFILTDYTEDCSAFSKIAPTIALPWLAHDVFGHFKKIADVLGMQERAASWLKQHEQKVQKAKKFVNGSMNKEETVSILNVRATSLLAYGVRNIGHVLYRSLELTPPAIIQEKLKNDPHFWATPISEKQLSAYAGDWMFVHVFDDDLSRAHLQALMKQESWNQLPAVQKGQVVLLNPTWFAYDPLSLEVQLEEAVQFLTKQKQSWPPYYPNKNGISSMDVKMNSR
ncbi:hypothetical protein BRE01_10800 [Brevibacillus reuszeri]|uniref:AraC family transcriptional regulator n=1 Tax=Brevibacillus reuszeri TaxID=54915 RepID=A0ABQ0THL9_9BACL|nr:helix-turn-helix domain-containing protein [Brevibacillus reuszeri]MED1855472.1 AraC family transcriptional regulator [Brevibacillus reuszeri]GED67378.1 hypothetical protein BRE01_10800 [Brevibacillus reuszeri]